MVSAQTIKNIDTVAKETTIPRITPNGESIVSWNDIHVLIPDQQTIPTLEGTHLQVVLPIDTQGALPVLYLEPKKVLQASLVAIAVAKQLVADPIMYNQHVNLDIRTIRPSFEGSPKGRYSCLVIEVYGRRLRGKHFGEPAPTDHNHWEGNRVIYQAERTYMKDVLAKKITAQLEAYAHIALFTEREEIPYTDGPHEFTLWNGGRYRLVTETFPLLDAKKHGFHFVLRNIPEDLQSVWYDPTKTIEMIGIGIGIGRFLQEHNFQISDAFYDINMNWGIFWEYFRQMKEQAGENEEKLRALKQELKKKMQAKMALAKEKKQTGGYNPDEFNITHVYMEALLSIKPNTVHLHAQFAKGPWEIPSKPYTYMDHEPVSEEDRYTIKEALSGERVGTGHDPLSHWVMANCAGRFI